jgi:Mg-chelatase subunit ChlD
LVEICLDCGQGIIRAGQAVLLMEWLRGCSNQIGLWRQYSWFACNSLIMPALGIGEEKVLNYKMARWLVAFAMLILTPDSSALASAVQFEAVVTVEGPGVSAVYKLNVGERHYRIQKTKGLPDIPSYPVIVDRGSGESLVLMPQLKKYVPFKQLNKTVMLNPIAGWELTRKLMKQKAGPVEQLDGRRCQTYTYYLSGLKEPVAKMWHSQKLDHVLRDERYGGKKPAVMELRNITQRPQYAGLFQTPAGYSETTALAPPKPHRARAAQVVKPAQITHSLQIILDASGSMRAKIGKRTKMAIAKQALLDLAGDLKGREDLALAIRVYGHQSRRDKKDCKDSKLEIPFGAVDQERIIALLKGIKPQGYTPLAYSLRQAARDFKHPKPERSIILITDGLETCKGDPCAVARKLASAGLKVTLHVVGFDLKRGEMQKLSCLTKPSGGLLLEAKNAGELGRALKKAIKRVVDRNLIVKAISSGGKPRQVHVEVFKAGTSERLDIRQGPVTGFVLQPGHYDLVVRDSKTSQVARLKNLKVAADKVTTKTVSFESGRLTLIFKSTKGVAFNKGYAEVIRTEGENELEHKGDYLIGKPKTFNVVAGTYTIKAQVDKMGHKVVLSGVEVEPGQEVVREIAFGRARLTVLVKDPAGRSLPFYTEVWRLEEGSPSGYKSGTSQKQALSFELTPGQYQIKAKRSDTGKKAATPAFELPDGVDMTKEVVIP